MSLPGFCEEMAAALACRSRLFHQRFQPWQEQQGARVGQVEGSWAPTFLRHRLKNSGGDGSRRMDLRRLEFVALLRT
jgi:hypothetical protein